MKLFSSFLIGALFGLGIAISGMANPAKVINFFDLAGTFDPSLVFVMGGALLTASMGYRFVFRRHQSPVFEGSFLLPENRRIDVRLIAGSATFGVGWGIAGFCPGGAIPALGLLEPSVLVFLLSLIAGIVVARLLQSWALAPEIAN